MVGVSSGWGGGKSGGGGGGPSCLAGGGWWEAVVAIRVGADTVSVFLRVSSKGAGSF